MPNTWWDVIHSSKPNYFIYISLHSFSMHYFDHAILFFFLMCGKIDSFVLFFIWNSNKANILVCLNTFGREITLEMWPCGNSSSKNSTSKIFLRIWDRFNPAYSQRGGKCAENLWWQLYVRITLKHENFPSNAETHPSVHDKGRRKIHPNYT